MSLSSLTILDLPAASATFRTSWAKKPNVVANHLLGRWIGSHGASPKEIGTY